MNTTDDIEHNDTAHDDSAHADTGQDDTAARRAEAGVSGWEDAVRLQRWATPDHADFYALAGEIVATLYALDDLAQVLRRQVAGYGQAQQDRGRRLYDDSYGQVDPAVRLADAVDELDGLAAHLPETQGSANRFWSAIGHIGVEDVTR